MHIIFVGILLIALTILEFFWFGPCIGVDVWVEFPANTCQR